ncbi:MAG: sodium/proline symporter [Vicinamibacterales bacterium]|nr:sodium/proline symporter [Vicinamibacterales bacterium]
MTYEGLSHPLAMTVFLATLLLPVLVGVLAMRRTSNQSDFLLGGRTMGRLVVALSAVSSGRSSWLVLGVSGMAYMRGTGAVWAVAGYTLAELLQFVFIGRPLRVATGRHESLTLLDYFESRFNDTSHVIRITGAIIIGVFLTAYVAAQFNAGAKALSTALDLPLLAALAISGVLVMIYMVMGGFVAVAYNDVVRAFILIVGLVVLPAAGLFRMGGIGPLLATLEALHPAHVDPFSIGAGALLGFLGIGLGSPGQPHVVVRYMSVDDPDRLRSAAVIGTIWNVVLGWGAVFIGLVGRAQISDPASLPGGNPEMVFLVLSSQGLGPLLYGLLVGGIFAAILSTVDSQLLVVASTAVRDVYEKILMAGQPVSARRALALNRIVIVVAGVGALAFAYAAQDLVFWLVLFAWGGLGAAIGPALILSLTWPRTTRAGVVAGMITGAVTTIVWKQLYSGPTGIYELLVAFPAAVAAIVIVSLTTAPQSPGPKTASIGSRPPV